MFAHHDPLLIAFAHHRAGRLRQAADTYRVALAVDPGNPDALHLLGLIERHDGRPGRSARLMERALDVYPGSQPARLNLARLYQAQGQPADAEALLRRSWAMGPDVEIAVTLAALCLAGGSAAAAVTALRAALALSPARGGCFSDLALGLDRLGAGDAAVLACHGRACRADPEQAGVWLNRAAAQMSRGQALAALGSATQGCALAPGDAGMLVNRANALQALGRLGEALVTYEAAVAADPLRPEARMGLATTVGRLVPQWHAPMMNDAVRNDAYETALRRAVGPDTHVLEIGTGAGLLALMAAAAGARRVTTCEMVPAVAATAAAIVAANGLSDRITVVPRRSDTLDAAADLGGRADVLVSEILSSELLSEGVLPSLEDARARLLKPGGTVIPRAGSLRCALVGGAFLERHFDTDAIKGFRFGRFRRLVSRRAYLHAGAADCDRLSPVFEPFRFDFAGNQPVQPERRRLAVPVTADGRCLGVLQWIRLEMDVDTVFENDPADRQPVSGWQPVVYLFDAPVPVRAGGTVTLLAWHNRNQPWFLLEGDG